MDYNSRRKGSVVGFLYEAGLIGQKGVEPVINLEYADLEGANLWKANLEGADLRKVNLWKADLIESRLMGANLKGADLWKANLTEANLCGYLAEANLGGTKLEGANL